MEPTFEPVLHMGVPFDVVRLRPQICSAVGPTEFQRDRVVHLAANALLCLTGVLSVDLALYRGRHLPNPLGVARGADVRHRDVQRVAGREMRIRQGAGADHARWRLGEQRDGEQ